MGCAGRDVQQRSGAVAAHLRRRTSARRSSTASGSRFARRCTGRSPLTRRCSGSIRAGSGGRTAPRGLRVEPAASAVGPPDASRSRTARRPRTPARSPPGTLRNRTADGRAVACHVSSSRPTRPASRRAMPPPDPRASPGPRRRAPARRGTPGPSASCPGTARRPRRPRAVGSGSPRRRARSARYAANTRASNTSPPTTAALTARPPTREQMPDRASWTGRTRAPRAPGTAPRSRIRDLRGAITWPGGHRVEGAGAELRGRVDDRVEGGHEGARPDRCAQQPPRPGAQWRSGHRRRRRAASPDDDTAWATMGE